MKPITLLLSLLMLISFSTIAQTIMPASTTEEEYNYLTKGYATQVSDGLDMKKGYHFKDIGSVKQSNYEFTFKELVRESTNEVAGILVITRSFAWNKTD